MIIPKFSINFYGIIIVLSMFVGMIYIYKSNKTDKNIFLFFLMYISFAFILGKIFTIITTEKDTLLTSGLSSYGGLIGVIVAALIYEKIIPRNNQIIKDSILSLPLTYAIAKIACFLAGCCYGIPYQGPLSVTYKDGLNISLFPVQVLETIVFVSIFLYVENHKNQKNIIYNTILLGSLSKFILDFLRYEHINNKSNI